MNLLNPPQDIAPLLLNTPSLYKIMKTSSKIFRILLYLYKQMIKNENF